VRVHGQVRDKNSVQQLAHELTREATSRRTEPEILTKILRKMEDQSTDIQSKIDGQLP